MAARLTEEKKKKIVADYVCLGSYNAVAKINGVALNTVKAIVQNAENAEFAERCKQKRDEEARNVMEYLESQSGRACQIIDLYLGELANPEKVEKATVSQITTALGTLIDKWAMIKNVSAGTTREDDPLTKALREEAERMNENGRRTTGNV